MLEDAAQAIGARHGDRAAGTMGRAGAFSFFPAKNLGALGDAGAVVTDDAALADRMRALRQHGAKERYRHELLGGNFRLDALQAAFLEVKLPRLPGWEEARRRIAHGYADLLADAPGIALPEELAGRRHVYNQYVVRLPGGRRDRVADHLRAAGIATAVYYPAPLHVQPCFDYLGARAGDFPESERASAETLALPIDPLLAQSDIERVAAAIRAALSEAHV